MSPRNSRESDSTDLPSDILERVIKDFGAEQADEVYRHLVDRIPEGLANGTRPRHLRCILYLAKGDRTLLEQYIEMCLEDTRDVMLRAEYETDARLASVRKRNFAQPFDPSEPPSESS